MMAERWTPPLHVRESAGRCRLLLGGWAHGDGHTLQQAADDLIGRLRSSALAMRTSGFRFLPELPLPDREWLEFLWELGDRAARGEDIRDRVFGRLPEASA